MPTLRRLLLALILGLALLGVGGWGLGVGVRAASSEQRAASTQGSGTRNHGSGISYALYASRFTFHVSRFTFHAPTNPQSGVPSGPRNPQSAAPTPTLAVEPGQLSLGYDEYVNALHAAYDAVAAGRGQSEAAQATAAQTALAAVPASARVGRFNGTQPVTVDTAPVRAALERTPPNLTEAAARLRALLDLLAPGLLPVPTALPNGTPLPAGSLVDAPVGPPRNDEQAMQQLDQVLADPRFHYEQRTTLQQRLREFLRPFVEALFTMDPLPRAGLVGSVAGLIATLILYIAWSDRPWSRATRLGRAALGGLGVGVLVAGVMLFGGPTWSALGPVAPYLLGAGGIVAALLAIGVFGLGLRRGRSRGAARLPLATHIEAEWTAAHARAAAAEAAAGGDYRRAIRYRYLATMMSLDEADRLRFDRALTNLEHLRRAPAHLREALRPLVLTFDRVWYGGSPASAADYQQYTALAQAVEAVPAETEVRA